MVDRLLSDNLTRQDVLQIIGEIQKQNLSWSSQDIDKAWTKTHHIKNEDLANQARENGNIQMQAGQWTQALTCYNQAVILAPSTSQTLTLVIANRAMVWIKLQEYQKAHLDLNWVLTIGKYPKDSLYKIWQRLATVLFESGKMSESKDAYVQAYESLLKSNVSNDVKRKNIEELKIGIQKAKTSVQKLVPDLDKKRAEHFLLEEHEELSGFSSKINVQYSEAKGTLFENYPKMSHLNF